MREKNTFLGTETKLFSDPFLSFFSVSSGKIVFNFWNRSQMLLEVSGDARQRRRKCTDFMFIGRHHQFPQTFNLYFPPRFQCSLKKTGAKILWVKPGKSTASTLSANIVFHFLRRRMEPAAHIYYTTSPFLHSNFKLVWRSLKVNLVQIMLSFRFHERPISKHSKHLQAK